MPVDGMWERRKKAVPFWVHFVTRVFFDLSDFQDSFPPTHFFFLAGAATISVMVQKIPS
jgi:hypothetical protein